MPTPYFVEQVLSAAREAEADNERGALLKAKLADELERYHRSSCYPDALEQETAIAVCRIIEALMEFGQSPQTKSSLSSVVE